jgi:hypothetical protein
MITKVKGYKALNQDMSTNFGIMKYKVGKPYIMDEDIMPCHRGFHFCKKIEHIQCTYSLSPIMKNRLFEITAFGKVLDNSDLYNFMYTEGLFDIGRGTTLTVPPSEIIKYCTNKIVLTREVSRKEIEEYVKSLDIDSTDSYEKQLMASQGINLDKFICDLDYNVRAAAVLAPNMTKDLLNKVSMNDKSDSVRCEIPKSPLCDESMLAKLSIDPSLLVRRNVASSDKATFDILLFLSKSMDYSVRCNAMNNPVLYNRYKIADDALDDIINEPFSKYSKSGVAYAKILESAYSK